MQYQVTCKQCHQLYVVDTNPGTTIRSRCPYCGTVATPAGHEVLRFSFSAATKDEACALVHPFVQFFAPIVAHAFFPPRFFAHPSGRGAVLCRRNPPPYLGYFPLLCLQGNECVAAALAYQQPNKLGSARLAP